MKRRCGSLCRSLPAEDLDFFFKGSFSFGGGDFGCALDLDEGKTKLDPTSVELCE